MSRFKRTSLGQWYKSSAKRIMTIVVVSAALLFGATFGAVEIAGAQSNTTYYAYLGSGKLTKVGTTSPSCTAQATVISWNSEGPAGTTGASGATGPQGPAGSTVNTCTSPPGIGYDFEDCSLSDVDWNFADLTGAMLQGAQITDGQIEGANATLFGTNLSGSNMEYISLTNINGASSNLSSANLTGANLNGANLTNADLDNATVTGVQP